MDEVQVPQLSIRPRVRKVASPMIVEVVSFTTALSEEDVQHTIEARVPEYRAFPGLVQKLYIRDPLTGEYGGVYLWEGETPLRRFRESDLARSIPSAYQVEGKPRVQKFDVTYIV